MVLPIVSVPETIRSGMAAYRELFVREEGFEHVSRYVAGLVLSPNKSEYRLLCDDSTSADPRRLPVSLPHLLYQLDSRSCHVHMLESLEPARGAKALRDAPVVVLCERVPISTCPHETRTGYEAVRPRVGPIHAPVSGRPP
jgi:hypothetical protein